MGTIPKLEDCNPGIAPVEYNVVIAPEETETVSKGGIIFTEQAKSINDMASMRGILVAVSPLAFNYDDWQGARKPQVGDHVLFGKYTGTTTEGADGKTYRLTKDREVAAVIMPASAQLKAVA